MISAIFDNNINDTRRLTRRSHIYISFIQFIGINDTTRTNFLLIIGFVMVVMKEWNNRRNIDPSKVFILVSFQATSDLDVNDEIIMRCELSKIDIIERAWYERVLDFNWEKSKFSIWLPLKMNETHSKCCGGNESDIHHRKLHSLSRCFESSLLFKSFEIIKLFRFK